MDLLDQSVRTAKNDHETKGSVEIRVEVRSMVKMRLLRALVHSLLTPSSTSTECQYYEN